LFGKLTKEVTDVYLSLKYQPLLRVSRIDNTIVDVVFDD